MYNTKPNNINDTQTYVTVSTYSEEDG